MSISGVLHYRCDVCESQMRITIDPVSGPVAEQIQKAIIENGASSIDGVDRCRECLERHIQDIESKRSEACRISGALRGLDPESELWSTLIDELIMLTSKGSAKERAEAAGFLLLRLQRRLNDPRWEDVSALLADEPFINYRGIQKELRRLGKINS